MISASSNSLGARAMLRVRLNDALKVAMKAKERRKVSTLRLILAALKDREIAVRTSGKGDDIGDDEVLKLLAKMVRQRRESIRRRSTAWLPSPVSW